MLSGKNILIGVTGSIAAYKALELVRLFVKSGANVRVLMSEDAKKFITPLSFEALCNNTVLSEDTQSWSNDLNHIHINKWADIFVIAPATANSINKLSNGIADNLLTSTALAFTKQIILAPAANTFMFMHQSTQESLKRLKSFGYEIMDTKKKHLACGDLGDGALCDIETIFYKSAKSLLKNPFWIDKKVVVTGGGTIEKIDDVRFVSNFSSGKMANSLSLALYLAGADVRLIRTYQNDDFNFIPTVQANSTQEMKKELNYELKNADYLFMAAAVSDYIPKTVVKGKIKKEAIGKNLNLEFIQNDDLLLQVDKKKLKTIGFKAEFDTKNALICANKMLCDKGLDAVCLNILGKDNSFGSDNNEIIFINKKERFKLSLKSKLEISFEILKKCEEL